MIRYLKYVYVFSLNTELHFLHFLNNTVEPLNKFLTYNSNY